MKYFFDKKRFLFFIFLFCLLFVVLFYFQFISFIFNEKTSKHSFNVNNVKKIKSSCRELSLESKDASENRDSPQRIQQLSQLMDRPINWVFQDIHGDVIDLYCLRNNQNLIINFWATWCPPCIEELPSLSRLAENNEGKIFVVAISTEPVKTITDFLNQFFSDLSPHLKIAQISKENKLQLFPEDSLPTTYIFNKKGLLKIKELGARDWSEKNLAQQIINLP